MRARIFVISMGINYRPALSYGSGKKTVDGRGKITDGATMLQITHLLALADEYQRVDRVADTTLSFRVFADSKKLAALRADGDMTTARFNLTVQWFSDNWPDGAVWPAGIDRPRVAA